MLSHERLAIIVSLATLGLGLSLSVNVAAVPILALTLAVIVGLGTEYVFHTIRGHRFALSSVVLPALLAFIGTFFLRLEEGVALVVGLLATGVLLYGTIACEYAVLHHTGSRMERLARNVILLLIYCVAFALYLVVYQAKLRSLISATAISLATVALAHRFLSLVEGRSERVGWYAVITGLCVGEIMWALNYWVLTAFAGGLFLLTCFYFIVGLLRQHLLGTLRRAVIIEYGAISLLSVAIILGSARLFR